MSKFTDMKIDKKLALVFGSSTLLVLSMTGVSLWAIHAIHEAMALSQSQEHLVTAGQTVLSSIGGIGQRVATMVLSDERREQLETELLALRKDYMASFDELKASATTDEEKRALGEAEKSASHWRDADNRALALLKAGKRAEAVRLHDSEIVPRYHEVSESLGRYRVLRVRALATINSRADTLTERTTWFLIVLGLAVLISAVVGTLIIRGITGALGKSVINMENIARGNLAHEMSPGDLVRKDEIGALANAAQGMTNNLRDMIGSITQGVGVLSSSSAELSTNSIGMSESAHQASDKSHAVAAAAEQMTANAASVAAGMEQTTANLASVASATEQMTATIGEIAHNSEKARRITEEATRQAARISEQMNQLTRLRLRPTRCTA